MSLVRRIVFVDIPEACPHIFLGLRTGISLALILVVISEMLIGSESGLGKVIYDMRYTDDIPRMYSALFIAGLLGWGFNWMVQFAEVRLIRWRSQ